MTSGIIAAGHPQTAQAGAEILRAGGNAVDAAVAATFASFVAEPTLVTPGGGGHALVYRRRDGHAWLYDFFCNTPGLGCAKPSSEVDFFPVSVDFGPTHQIFHIGRGSVAVPGNIAGLCRLQKDKGRLPLAEVLQPAITLARRGVALGDFCAYVAHLLHPIFNNEPELATLMGAPDLYGNPHFEYQNPALADLLEALGREGADLVYRGDVARSIVADQEAHGGLLTRHDLENYRVIVREPLRLTYRGMELYTNPPPSRGGALIAFSLALLEPYEVPSLAHGSTGHVVLLAEVMRQTNLARPTFESSGDVELFFARDHVEYHRQDLARRLARPGHAAPTDLSLGPGHHNTSHVSVLDGNGNIVSLTTTAGETPGYVLADYGLVLNNIMGEEDLHPHGFHRGRPGERIGSMMAPTVVLRDGEPVLAVGSGGSNRIRTAILQVILNFTDFGFDLQRAVSAPRIHFEGGTLQIEAGGRPETVAQLERWGYELVQWPDLHMFFGGAHSVGRGADGGFQGAGDPRRNGAVVGVD
ncbi:MAG: gamma-glutamyltransferase [Caldilineae bacterium]|nr:MAG: gamma-glutamyltransferase [Caldilineae bacterium]